MYKNAENVTIPALIDDPEGGGDDPGAWANSSAYDSDPTTIYLIGPDTTFEYLVEFALMGWQMSYDELDVKIQELLDNTSNENILNINKQFNNILNVSNNRIEINGIDNFTLNVYNLQGKELLKFRNQKIIELSNKLSKGSFLITIDLISGEKIKRSIVIK